MNNNLINKYTIKMYFSGTLKQASEEQVIMYISQYLIRKIQYNSRVVMQQTNSPENISKENRSQSEAPNTISQTSETSLYFHSILCIPTLLDNPTSNEGSFMTSIFRDRQIKRVRRNKDYISVDIVRKTQHASTNVMEIYQFKDSQLQNELKQTYQSLSQSFSKREGQEGSKFSQGSQEQYYQWFESMKDKSIIGWYVPYSDKGPNLKTFSISLGLMTMLGYKIDELALDVQHLGAQALDLVDGQAYKATFLMIVNSMRKLKQMEKDKSLTKEQIFKQGETIIVNQMKGKVNKKITVETKIYMASENIVCYEVLRLLDQKQVRDNERKLNRDDAVYKLEQNAFKSLSKIAKLPKIIDPGNSAKICGYVQIRTLRANRSKQKQQQEKEKAQKTEKAEIRAQIEMDERKQNQQNNNI